VTATVWDFALPEGHYATTAFGNFNSSSGYWATGSLLNVSGSANPLALADQPAAQAEAKAIVRAWYDLLLDHGICGYELPWGLVDDDPRAAQAYLLDPRVTSVLVPADQATAAAYRDLVAGLPGVTDKTYFYPLDEPSATAANAALIGQLAAQVEAWWPGAHAVIPGPGKEGSLAEFTAMLRGRTDILCLNASAWANDYATAAAAQAEWQARGDQVWLYPAGWQLASFNVLHWGVNNPGLDRRLLLWQAYKLGVDGLLYWQTAWWEAGSGTSLVNWDPWLPGQAKVQQNGDGTLLYPGHSLGLPATTLVPSLRLKQIADALEDYDYLVLAEQALGQAFVDAQVGQVVLGDGADPGSIMNVGLVNKYRGQGKDYTGVLERTRRTIGEALEGAGFDYTCGAWTEALAPDATHEGLELRTCDGGAQESRAVPATGETGDTLATIQKLLAWLRDFVARLLALLRR